MGGKGRGVGGKGSELFLSFFTEPSVERHSTSSHPDLALSTRTSENRRELMLYLREAVLTQL